MLKLTDREKRMIRFGAVVVPLLLILIFGGRGWKRLEAKRTSYSRLVREAKQVQRDFRNREHQARLVEELKKSLRIDPRALSNSTLLADASSAIQKAASSGKLKLGPIRETPGRSTAKELASFQLEGVGGVSSIATFLHRVQLLGYPLLIDSVQLSPVPKKTGTLKVNLKIVLLDAAQWIDQEDPNA